MNDLNVAVADKSKFALRKAREMGVKETYSDYKKLLQKANVDAVVITLPNFLHKKSTCLSAEENVDIFIEKLLECFSITSS